MEEALIRTYKGVRPQIAPDAWIAPGAAVIGDVEIGAESSVWYQTTVRGDVSHIRIGARTNLQDGTVVHVTHEPNTPTIIGDEVLVGHASILHGCTLESNSYVGMGSLVMDGAVIESGAMLGARGFLPPGKRIRSGELWLGSPARFARNVTPEELRSWAEQITLYVEMARAHRDAG